MRNNNPLTVYSAFLNEWLIVTRYQSDVEWYFLKESDVRATERRAEVPFSQILIAQGPDAADEETPTG